MKDKTRELLKETIYLKSTNKNEIEYIASLLANIITEEKEKLNMISGEFNIYTIPNNKKLYNHFLEKFNTESYNNMDEFITDRGKNLNLSKAFNSPKYPNVESILKEILFYRNKSVEEWKNEFLNTNDSYSLLMIDKNYNNFHVKYENKDILKLFNNSDYIDSRMDYLKILRRKREFMFNIEKYYGVEVADCFESIINSSIENMSDFTQLCLYLYSGKANISSFEKCVKWLSYTKEFKYLSSECKNKLIAYISEKELYKSLEEEKEYTRSKKYIS